jgi:hypothetical protein
MTLNACLTTFQAECTQCSSLIASAHTMVAGVHQFPEIDRQQITIAAFLNFYIAWESFLETSLCKLMVGEPTISGTAPVRYVSPPTIAAAQNILIGTQRYFDFANHVSVKKIVNLYFKDGYPYEPFLSAVLADLAALKKMRNASAHISSTTTSQLNGVMQGVLTVVPAGMGLYQFLVHSHPTVAGQTIFTFYQGQLLTASQLIATG